jgi:nitroreductase
MLLAARDLGLGTLWIGNVFYVEKRIQKLLSIHDELIAAIAVGYADEEPEARPRKDVSEVVEWM